MANIGVHGKPATLHLETLWTRDVTITTGLVDGYSTPTLLRLVMGRQLDAGRFANHHFPLAELMEAYDVFARAADTGALKVILSMTVRPSDRSYLNVGRRSEVPASRSGRHPRAEPTT